MRIIKKDKLQLIGVSSMLIASKYEDIYAPEIRDFIYITDKNYTRDEILKTESDILSTLQYDLLSVYSITFLTRYHFLSGGDRISLNLANLILEFCLLEYKMLEYNQSLKACAALYLARKILNINDNWNTFLVSETGYTESDLAECVKDLCKVLEVVPKSKLQSSLEKYRKAEFNEVALLICDIPN
jgi:hypothetical protein